MLSNKYLPNSQKKLFYGIAAGIVTSNLVVAKGVYEYNPMHHVNYSESIEIALQYEVI